MIKKSLIKKTRVKMSSFHSLINYLVHTLIVMAFIITLGFNGNANAFEKSFPFHPGEKLIFQAKWGFIPAGEAVIETLPMANISGTLSYHFVMETKTSARMDVFYKAWQRQDSYTDIDMNRSILYKKLSKGKHPRDVIVNFDWAKHEATYSNFGEKMKPIAILPGSFDPLSLFFVIRLYDLKENVQIEIPVTDGKKCMLVKATVAKREKITLSGKTYDTYLVEPDMESIGGVFKKSKNAKLKIWFTADERKIPVKIRSKAGIGCFIFELISAVHYTELQ